MICMLISLTLKKKKDAVTTEIPLEAQLRSPSRDTALGTTHHGHSVLKVNITSSPLDITNGPNPRLKTPGEAHEAHHWSGDYSSQMQKPSSRFRAVQFPKPLSPWLSVEVPRQRPPSLWNVRPQPLRGPYAA